MIDPKIPIYLASQSPRRRKLLKQINLSFKSFSVDVDEQIFDSDTPVKTVKRLASTKMDAALNKGKDGIIITADTIVVLDKKILGKPKSVKNAEEILKMLSGRTHQVYTGFVIHNSITGKRIVDYVRTSVTFRKLEDKEIKDYVKTGSPMDKAGAYGIQDDFGAVFVSKINGCYYNVVGLPLSKVYSALKSVI